MPVVVEAVTPVQFDIWLTEQQKAKTAAAAEAEALLSQTLSKEELMSEGQTVYMGYCAACHQPTGLGLPGVFPALKDNAVVKGDVEAHIDVLLNGRPGTAMQAFAKQLTVKQIAAVITYKRNSWGNDTGEVIQPSQVQAFIDKASGE
jgi:cytochrome c oxidase subunit 2